jgi:hypothetical protein
VASGLVRIAAALVAIYVTGVVAGAVLAMVTRGPAGSATAIATATPTPMSTASSTVAPTSSTPTTPSATVAVPSTPVQPTATAAASPSSGPSPSAAASPSPEPSPSAVPSPTLAADPTDIPAFVADLGRAIDRGSGRFLLAHLHPAVIDRYGARACRLYTSTTRLDGLSLEHLGSDGPAAWDWVLDELTTAIPDAWTVTVVWRQPDLEEQREIHIAPADGTWRWFTDCGDPV